MLSLRAGVKLKMRRKLRFQQIKHPAELFYRHGNIKVIVSRDEAPVPHRPDAGAPDGEICYAVPVKNVPDLTEDIKYSFLQISHSQYRCRRFLSTTSKVFPHTPKNIPGDRLSIISRLFSRIAGIMNPVTTFVKNCVTSEASAAPFIPNTGISRLLRTIFAKAPAAFIGSRYFCFFSARSQMFLTDPRYENDVYHTTIRSVPAAGAYAAP